MLTLTQVREEVELFVATYPTPNAQRALALCLDGTLTWRAVHALFADALRAGLAEVGA